MNRAWVILMAALPPSIWGSTYLVTTECLPADKPLTAAVLRILPVGLLLVLFNRHWPRPEQWLKLLVLSLLCMSLLHWPLFVSAYRLPGGLAALLICAQPLIVLVLGYLLFQQRTKARILLASLIGLAGVALVLVSPSRLVWDTLGILAAALAACSMALGTLLIRRWQLNIPVWAFTGWQLLLGGLLLLPFMYWFEQPLPTLQAKHVGGYLYLAVLGTLIPYLLWFSAMRSLEPVLISIFLLLSPLSALTLGYFFLDQTLTLWQLAGALTVFAGIVLSQYTTRPRASITTIKT
ncbi:EamA family transporter [Pseudomonas benzenivorans]|uniref:EamA family transporter n=1 Tax=Pseudomonas benzenivorans TaxID=556533 RepID=A0ABY5HAT3_9PSED|nr:EamA family transporter [Pseudomonas benzenivorans]UTW08932.1 EamA family transporter [Pseudomonas benzenivorans]